MAATILTFDIGTSSVKAGLFDRETGNARWLHREPLASGDPPDIWVTEQWVRAIQATMDQCPDPEGVAAVALSGNGPTVIPVAPDGTPLDDALLWLDRRELRVPGQPSFFLPKIDWFRREHPAVYEHTWQFMTCPEYLSFLMGAVPHSTSPSEAFDRFVWDNEGVARYGIDASLLPPLVRPGARVGAAGARARELFGLPVGTPVFAAGPDFLMSLLGTATVAPGTTCDRAGTSEGINHCCAGPTDSAEVRCLPHVVPGLWNVAGVLSSTGRIFEWFRRISRQRSVGYERMLAEIEAVGFEEEPFFFPSTHRGAAWEFSRGMFVGLRSDHATAEMGRGVVHSIGYAVRQSIESLRRAGCDVTELTACGGQAKNPIWNQMKADITGVPLRCPEVLDAELVGNLCCACAGLGDFAAPWDAAPELVCFSERYEPSVERHDQFTTGYETYLSTYERFLTALHEGESGSANL
ncbi:MAG: xylulokinase [Spirochaetota bacterium]